jgi:hypothetical protein
LGRRKGRYGVVRFGEGKEEGGKRSKWHDRNYVKFCLCRAKKLTQQGDSVCFFCFIVQSKRGRRWFMYSLRKKRTSSRH